MGWGGVLLLVVSAPLHYVLVRCLCVLTFNMNLLVLK